MWIKTSKQMPPKDYEFQCFILFKDGHVTLSDGGTVCNDILGQIACWMHIHAAAFYLPTKED